MMRSIVAAALALAIALPGLPAWAAGDQPRLLLEAAQPRGDAGQGPGAAPGEAGGKARAFGVLAADSVIPLQAVLGGLRQQYAGEILDAQLFERNGQPFYRIKLLGADGKVQLLVVDARTGAVVDRR